MRVSCTICQDLFIFGSDISATTCGHTFHSECVNKWFEREKSCPQCRQKVKKLTKLYFSEANFEATQVDPDHLQNQVDNLLFKVKLKEQEVKNLTEENSTFKIQNAALRAEYKELESDHKRIQTTQSAMRMQLKDMVKLKEELKESREMVKLQDNNLETFRSMQKIYSGVHQDIQNVINSYSASGDIHGLVMSTTFLNTELKKAVDDKNKFRKELSSLQFDYKQMKGFTDSYKENMKMLESENAGLRKKVQSLEEAITSPSGDVKNSAINRLLRESPAPLGIKRAYENDTTLAITPDVISKDKRQKKSSQDFNLDDSISELLSENKAPSISKKITDNESPHLPLKSSYPTLKSGSFRLQQNQHNIFGKNRTLNEPKKLIKSNSISSTKYGYNGLGGHHKVDEFPVPRLKPPTKKITKSSSSSDSIGNRNIRDFLKNTFDSPF